MVQKGDCVAAQCHLTLPAGFPCAYAKAPVRKNSIDGIRYFADSLWTITFSWYNIRAFEKGLHREHSAVPQHPLMSMVFNQGDGWSTIISSQGQAC